MKDSGNPSSLRKRILEFFSHHPSESFKVDEIAHQLGLTKAHSSELTQTIRELEHSHLIRREQRKRYGHARPAESHHRIGTFRLQRQGYGIVTLQPPHEGTVLVNPRFMGTAFDGDVVSVAVFAHPVTRTAQKNSRIPEGTMPEGEIVEVIERSQKPIVGQFQKSRNFFVVVPDDRKIRRDIYIPKGKSHGARPGDKVVAVIEEWESPHLNPEGRIIEVLGRTGEVRAEMMSVVRMFNLPTSFPRPAVEEAEKISHRIPTEEYRKRLDLRKETCFTIDPEDAKDFDDAVSLEALPSGDFKLGVHIADVSHYVKEASQLDAEALKRSTSVYLADGVVPMLPEKLSNDICSLRPEEDRLTYSAIMIVTPKGVVKEYSIEKSVIRSKRRFTYEEVQKIIETGKGDFAAVILRMHGLAKTLLEKRLREGGIDFETAETKFRFDADGKPVEIIKKTRLDAHRLIEDFMLLANRTVANHIAAPLAGGKDSPRGGSKSSSTHSSAEQLRPFIYRIHDTPDPAKIEELASFVSQFGYTLNTSGGVSSRALQKLLHDVRGTEEEAVINEVAIRSMAKAIYSETNIGHFGLGFRHYTHFTSPIRRYPDLIVHRLLHEYQKKMPLRRRQHFLKTLPDVCRHTSAMEQRAVEAERESVKIMQVEYMKRHIGDEFRAVISGVAHFGLFIEITDLLVEGLVRVRDMEGDFYVYDEKHYALIGRRTKKRYRLGDKVNVKVVRVDPEESEIDFVLVD